MYTNMSDRRGVGIVRGESASRWVCPHGSKKYDDPQSGSFYHFYRLYSARRSQLILQPRTSPPVPVAMVATVVK